jgi:hypothetical protein
LDHGEKATAGDDTASASVSQPLARSDEALNEFVIIVTLRHKCAFLGAVGELSNYGEIPCEFTERITSGAVEETLHSNKADRGKSISIFSSLDGHFCSLRKVSSLLNSCVTSVL